STVMSVLTVKFVTSFAPVRQTSSYGTSLPQITRSSLRVGPLTCGRLYTTSTFVTPIVCETVAFGLGSGVWSCARAAGAEPRIKSEARKVAGCLRIRLSPRLSFERQILDQRRPGLDEAGSGIPRPDHAVEGRFEDFVGECALDHAEGANGCAAGLPHADDEDRRALDSQAARL